MSHTNVLLSTLSMSIWSAKKHDKKISQEVAADHGALANVGRYNKNLLPGEVASYKLIQQLQSETRAEFNQETLPWLDMDATRIVASTNFLNVSEKMRIKRHLLEDAYADFKAEAPLLFARQRALLNGMWREEDYPTGDKLAKKFSFSLRFFPMPDAADFRVKELTAEVIAETEANIQDGIAGTVRYLYTQLYDMVEHVHNRLSDPDAVFRDSLIVKLRDLCDRIPRLNFTEDAQLEACRQQVLVGLAQFEPEQLRESETLRETIASRAERIQSEMAIFIQGGV